MSGFFIAEKGKAMDEKVTTDEVTEESSDEQKTFDAEYVKQLREEAKKYRTDKAALKKEYEDAKAKLTALEGRLQSLKNSLPIYRRLLRQRI